MRRWGVYVSRPLSADEALAPFAEPAVFLVNPAGEFSCFLELPVEAENSQPTYQSLTDNYRNEIAAVRLLKG